jgi:hypothetical protein
LSGKCVSHEIDVLIKKDNELAMVENFILQEKITRQIPFFRDLMI